MYAIVVTSDTNGVKKKEKLSIFPSKAPFTEFLKLRRFVKVSYKIWSLSYFSARNPKI